MLLRRGASICRRWRQPGQVYLLARSASGSPANEDLNFDDLAEKQKPNPSSSNTDTLFGIAPIKVTNEEDEDFVSPSMQAPPPAKADPPAPPPENYFSKTWEMQKSTPLNQASYILDRPKASKTAQFPQLIPHGSTLKRIWQVLPGLEATSEETFMFASLKVLSEAVVEHHRRHLYKSVPLGVLDWKSRRRKLLADLDQLSADIICLQELDKFQDLQSDLAFKGYAGLFKASSTGRASCGCAIFWKQKRFQLLYEESIDFCLLDMRTNVAQLCVLQSTVPGTAENENEVIDSGNNEHNSRNRLIVGNIEVLFNPRRGEIKLGQCRAFLQQAHKLSTQWPGAPLVIGGCFHATPQSAIYQFLAESKVDVFGLESKYISGHLKKHAKSIPSPVTSSGTKSAFEMHLRQSLRSSISAKITSNQDANAVNSVDSSSGRVFNPSPLPKGDMAARAFVAKTLGILESCKKSPAASGVAVENIAGGAVSSRVSKSIETDIDSTSSSNNAESMVPSKSTKEELSSGSKTLNYSLPGVEAARHGRPCIPDADQEESVSLISVTSGGASVNAEEKVNAEDLFPRIHKSSGTGTESVHSIDKTNFVKPSGSAAELSSKFDVTLGCALPDDEAPNHDCSVTSDAIKEASSVFSHTCTETSADISTSSSTSQHGSQHGWDPEELKIASGSKDCTLVKHDLKLFSVYPEIPGQAVTRDSKGEPCVTMAHDEFKGTVDYIWRSEGLKTMKVLDTLSMNEILVSPLIPFMVSGSDHVSLACELCFSSSERRTY